MIVYNSAIKEKLAYKKFPEKLFCVSLGLGLKT